MELYPLKFQPLFKYRIWGGNKLKTQLNKKYEEENIGESWEVSDVENDETLVLEGSLQGKTLKQLISTFKEDFLGDKVYKEFGVRPSDCQFTHGKTGVNLYHYYYKTKYNRLYEEYGGISDLPKTFGGFLCTLIHKTRRHSHMASAQAQIF